MWQHVERILTVVLAVAALIATAGIVRATLRAPPSPDELRTTFLDNWEAALDASVPFAGFERAPVTIVAVMDLQCPACRALYRTLSDISSERPRDVRVAYIHHPLEYHEAALPAARAAECAARRGSLRSWVSAVYAKQDSLGTRPWGAYADDAGIQDTSWIRRCAEDEAPVPRIQAGLRFGEEIALEGVPTVIVNGWRFSRSPTKSELDGAIESILEGDRP